MKKSFLANITKGLLSTILGFYVAHNSASANMEEHDHRKEAVVIEAELATGPNKFLDRPIRDHGVVFGWPMGTLGFGELGEYNPTGDEPIPLTSATPLDAELATFVDPNFIAAIGFDPNDLDPAFINVPLQEVSTLAEMRTPTGVTVGRRQLPAMFSSTPFQQSIAAPNEPITLEDWLCASGKAKIKCNRKGHSTIDIRFKHLIPNRIYTIWSANVSAELGPFNQPFAGAPSAFVTDSRGNARFKRKLNFCPLEPVESVQAQMLWLMVVLHTDHMAYGGTFAPNQDSLFGGTVAHVHLHIPLAGEPVE